MRTPPPGPEWVHVSQLRDVVRVLSPPILPPPSPASRSLVPSGAHLDAGPRSADTASTRSQPISPIPGPEPLAPLTGPDPMGAVLEPGSDSNRRPPITRRMLGVDLDGSRRIQTDRLDDHRDDQGASDAESDAKASNSPVGPAQGLLHSGGSMLSRVDQDGRMLDRSHTRGLSGTSRRSTPGVDRRSAAKRSPSPTPR